MSITGNLRDIQKAASFTVTDMAIWFDCGRSTMDLWLKGTEPLANKEQQLTERLKQLEEEVKRGKYFPIPLSVTQYQRKTYLLNVRDGANAKIPSSRPSAGGL